VIVSGLDVVCIFYMLLTYSATEIHDSFFYDFLSQRRQVSAELAHAEKEEKKIRGEEWAKRQVRYSIFFLSSGSSLLR